MELRQNIIRQAKLTKKPVPDLQICSDSRTFVLLNPLYMYYSGKEIVEIAVRIEENGYAFYIAAAEKIRETTDVKKLFLDLAEQETMHTATFQKIFENFQPEEYETSEENFSDYINNLADKHIFGKPDAGAELAKTLKTPREALEAAFKFENDSVAFYKELYSKVKSDSKPIIKQILAEEIAHAARIKKFL